LNQEGKMKLSVCIDALFKGQDFIKSMECVKNSGINAFEFWGWWDKNLQIMKKAADEMEMEITAFCTKFVSLVDQSKRLAYLKGLQESIEAAKKMGCKKLITQVGDELTNISREEQHKNIVQGLTESASVLEDEDITLLVEPLNTYVDHNGYYLSSSVEGFKIIDEVGSNNVKLLFDIYHQQIMEGDLISRITSSIEKIGHFHAAGNPGRHELDSGEISYGNIFKAIDQTGFTGYIGLEYFPVNNPVEGIMKLVSKI